MSHYTVLVITKKDGEDIDELLAPFSENLEVEPYIYKTKTEMISEMKKAKEQLEIRMKEKDDYEPNSWERQLLDANTDEEFYEAYLEEDGRYDEDGNELSTYNPNSKWDWYTVGGRWDGIIKTKDGDMVNECLASEIDLNCDKDKYNHAIRFWEVVVEEKPLEAGESKEDFDSFYNKDYYLSKYTDKYAYAKNAASFRTYAFLTPDGVWHEPGEMGWFGMSTDDAESNDRYEEEFEKMLEELEDTDMLHVVDCHI